MDSHPWEIGIQRGRSNKVHVAGFARRALLEQLHVHLTGLELPMSQVLVANRVVETCAGCATKMLRGYSTVGKTHHWIDIGAGWRCIAAAANNGPRGVGRRWSIARLVPAGTCSTRSCSLARTPPRTLKRQGQHWNEWTISSSLAPDLDLHTKTSGPGQNSRQVRPRLARHVADGRSSSPKKHS